MKGVFEGYVITSKLPDASNSRDTGSFEFLVLGDGDRERSKIMRVAGNGVDVDFGRKISLSLSEQEYTDKKSGAVRTFWKKV